MRIHRRHRHWPLSEAIPIDSYRQKGGHRHLTGGRPFNKTDRVRAILLAHIGSANGGLLTIDRVEQALAQANVLGRDLD